MRDQRNARIIAVADVALHITALAVTQGVEQLRAERVRALDGPDREDSAGRSSNETSTTERNANEAYRLGLLIEDLRDAVEGFEIAHRHLQHLAEDAKWTRAFGAPAPSVPEIPVCRDNQLTKRGNIEWGDATCGLAPVKLGLCQAHYMAFYRWRQRNDVETKSDFAA